MDGALADVVVLYVEQVANYLSRLKYLLTCISFCSENRKVYYLNYLNPAFLGLDKDVDVRMRVTVTIYVSSLKYGFVQKTC